MGLNVFAVPAKQLHALEWDIDGVDADLAAFNWCTQKCKHHKTFYAHRGVRKPEGKWTTVKLHQVIARRMGIVGAPDHIDGNGLNNLRSNLRPASNSQQQAHQGLRANNKSGYKGVHWHKRDLQWQAEITVNGKKRYLGSFEDEIEAAKAYDRAAFAAWGEFAVLNFPAPIINP